MALIEVRKFLEKKSVVLACRRATEKDVDRVKNVMEQIREAGEKNENISDVTVKLHLALAEATKNPIMVQLLDQIVPLIVTKARLMELPPEKDVEIHSGVAKALEERDEEKLKAWVDEHLGYLKERFIAHVESKELETNSNI